MDTIGVYCFVLYVILLLLSSGSIPQNQLKVYRGPARMIPVDIDQNPYGFRLISVLTANRKGPPVLFVHGHKGNAKQAIAMTDFFLKKGIIMNMYSLDFLEGAVGISHSLLYEEASFMQKALKWLAKAHPDEELVIIAHSMGGIVASLAITMADTPMSFIKGIICLSAPINSHPVNSYLALPIAYGVVHEL